jgi:hypothetical protein
MTIRSCIAFLDALHPNQIDGAIKSRWLCELEGKIRVELHEMPLTRLEEWEEDVDEDAGLIVPFPYDQLYWTYLVAMTHFYHGDGARYENAAALFNAAYQSYAKYLRRTGGV